MTHVEKSTNTYNGLSEEVLACYRSKRVLISGGNGYLATNLIGMLREVDCTIIRLVRDRKEDSLTNEGERLIDVTGDVQLRSTWERALVDVDVVYHLAAQTSVYKANQEPSADLKANVLPMLHLLETCRDRGLRPVVLFSGTTTQAGIPTRLTVDETHPDNPVTIYDLHKLMAENFLKYYANQEIVLGASLRLTNVYGPGPKSSSADRGVLNTMIHRALQGEALTVYGHGDYLRDYVYVKDVARAFLMAGANIDRANGQHFVIGSGQGNTIAEAFNLVADRVAMRTGLRVQVKHVQPPDRQSSIESRNFVADSKLFTQATGWRPNYSLPEGIDRTIEAYS